MMNAKTQDRFDLPTRSLFGAMLAMACLGAVAAADTPIKPGDRIAIVGNTFADQLRIHGYFETLLLQRTHGNPVSVRNLGWGGDMLTARDRPTNFPSESSTLTAHKTDVIIACFGMGESFAGPKGLDGFRKDVEAFIASHAGKKYNGKSDVRLILVSPIAYENLGDRTPNREQRNRDLKAYTRVMSEVAAAKRIPFVDLFESTLAPMNTQGAPKQTTNGIHLNQYGYWVVSRFLADAMLPTEEGWQVEFDAKTMTAESKGVSVSNVEKDDQKLDLSIKEQRFPMLAPPKGTKPHAEFKANRDVIVFKNLPKGRFKLSIDGKHIASATHAEWAKGVAVDSSPAHIEADALRTAVNEKNEQFIYSWKALNQVHIVGERRSSASGRALPREVIEFNKLAIQKDKALPISPSFKTRKWLLEPHNQ